MSMKQGSAARTGDSGTAGLTLNAMAKEAGASKGGWLHHFRSKDGLLVAILRELFAHSGERPRHDDEPDALNQAEDPVDRQQIMQETLQLTQGQIL